MPPSETAPSEVDAQRLGEWLAGSHSQPITVALAGAPCICESLALRCRADWGALLRICLMTLANHAPLSALKIACARLAGARIARQVYVSPHVILDPLYPQLIEIEEGALLGLGCRIVTHEYTAERFRLGCVRIGARAVIGAFATVRSGVTIGPRATIGMHSFVNRDVPEGVTVAGVPARPLPPVEARS